MFRNVLVSADQSYGSFAYISYKLDFQENNNFQFNEHPIHALLHHYWNIINCTDGIIYFDMYTHIQSISNPG